MAPDEESKSAAPQPEGVSAATSPRRDRRPGRGRRGRGRGGRPKAPPGEPVAAPQPEPEATIPQFEPEPIFELAEERGPSPVPPSAPAEAAEMSPESIAPATVPAPPRPTGPATVESAIEEVNGIIDTLRTALDEMEEVLEMLEVFERQQSLDEREIESLRRALRQGHRPREGGHQHHH
jgi:hypothetical protein